MWCTRKGYVSGQTVRSCVVQTFYPINHLRNIALDAADTDYAFLSDIDFVPNTDMYTYLIDILTAQPGMHMS
jgi:hypothetical protein